jgi:hypothetical protein
MAARGLAASRSWRETGLRADPPMLWGLCAGSGANPYQTSVDLTEPAYRCSCPSRKSPCKHALALMLLWSAGAVPAAEAPTWVTDWRVTRADRKEKAPRARSAPDSKAALRRAERVGAGLQELDRWLTDQVRQGLAGASRAGYGHWDTMAARLVDAQAPAVASAVRRLASAAGSPDRLLSELGLIRLLVSGHQRGTELPPDLVATVRSRIGYPVATEDVLAGERVRDVWAVVGQRDDGDERLMVRRVWLNGHGTGRPALILSFAPAGQPLPADLVPGTAVEADLCFYPGALPLRALVAHRYDKVEEMAEPPGAGSVAANLDAYASALAAEPWLERWPVLLADSVPIMDHSGRWFLVDGNGDALPLDPVMGPPWRLVAAAGGTPVTVAGELTQGGVRALTAWDSGRMVRL